MKTISRYIMTLALLITAVGGAWADSFSADAYTANATLNAVSVTANQTVTINKGVTVTVNNGLSIQSNATLTITGGGTLVVNGATGANGANGRIDTYQEGPFDPPVDVFVQPTAGGNGGAAITINSGAQLALSNATVIANGGQGGQGGWGANGDVEVWAANGANGNGFASFPTIDGAVLSYSTNGTDYTEYESGNTTLYRYMKVELLAKPDVDVTTNAASEQDLFTEASFKMPAFDATAEYELVRDLGYKVAFSGVPTRARLAKDGDGKFHFADGLTFQLLDNIDAANPKDITSAEGITFMVGEVEAVDIEGNTFYQLDKETLVPLADFLADAHLGNYAICAVASTGEYDGSFTSGTITLFQGYEVEVAAKSFATYYSDDEALTLDETFAETAGLYTISEVTATEAVLSEKIDVMPKRTPMLIYNESETLQTVLLIPTADVAPLTDVAEEFKGTAVEKTVSADEVAATNFYVLTDQNQFVWVKDAGTIAANKCWLEIAPSQAQAARRIVFSGSGTTGISTTDYTDYTDGTFYDLNGRKFIKKPTKKGIYIQNGKKVVIK